MPRTSSIDSSTGVGFAVPVDIVKAELPKLEAGATPRNAYVGVSAGDATNGRDGMGAVVQGCSDGAPRPAPASGRAISSSRWAPAGSPASTA